MCIFCERVKAQSADMSGDVPAMSIGETIAAEKCEVLRSRRIPVTLLTGFLGSGKTTVINHLLQCSDKKVAVVENEVGEVPVSSCMLRAALSDASRWTTCSSPAEHPPVRR